MFTRRQFITSCLSATGSFALPPIPLDHPSLQKRPNIIFFLVDDMGWQDVSLPFWRTPAGAPRTTFLNKRYHTPNLERLAKRGMMFTDAYAQPICSPTRVSLLTGMNSARHHVTNWTLFRDTNNDERAHPTLAPLTDWAINGVQPQNTPPSGITTRPLSRDPFTYTIKKPYTCATALPQLLAQAGYITIHCGKAHFGAKDTPGADPQNFGFHYNIAGTEIGGLANYRGKNHYGQGPFHIQGLDEDTYYTHDIVVMDALTQKAIHRLDALRSDPTQATRPFYLYMAHYAIHSPFTGDNCDPKTVNTYSDPKDGHPWNKNEQNYASLIEGTDRSLGTLMDWLDKNQLMDNTVIFFMSDNGGLALRSSGRIGNQESNFPLSFGKGSLREGGIREPMVVACPGLTPPGSICREPIIVEDFFPTILEIAGIYPNHLQQTLDGSSFVQLLHNPSSGKKPRALLFHQPNLWGEGSRHDPHYGAGTALRYGKWKLIYWHASQQFELFNLEEDISETQNLAKQLPQHVAQLVQKMELLLRERQAQFTSYKINIPELRIQKGDRVPWPIEAFLHWQIRPRNPNPHNRPKT